MLRFFLIIGLVVALITSVLHPQTVYAQAAKAIFASVSGQVLDPNGKPIPGSTVRLDGQSHLKTTSDSSGHFLFANVSPGTYTISVNASGYAAITRSGIAISNEDVNLNVSLAPATSLKTIAQITTTASGSINVSAAASYHLTPKDMAFQGQTQWRKVLEELPGVSITDFASVTSSSIPGSPINGQVVSIRGALPYETAMLIDNMPMYGSTFSAPKGTGVDLAPYNPQAFSSFDVVAGPGAQSPSIIGSIGGSLNLHPAGQVTQNGYDFSLSNDPYGGRIANGLVAWHVGKLSATGTYGFNNSPGPFNGRPELINLGSRVSAIDGVPFVCTGSCSITQTFPNGATSTFLGNGQTGGLFGCCAPNVNSAWVNHTGSLSLFYQLSSSVIAQFFLSDNSQTSGNSGFVFPTIFTPPAGYAGSLAANSTSLLVGNAQETQSLAEWSQVYEGKITFQFGVGQLQLAALSNTGDMNAFYGQPPSLGTMQLFGGGSYCFAPPCSSATLTPVVFNGTMNSVSLYPLIETVAEHAHNRDLSVIYATPLSAHARATASFVHAYYDYGVYLNLFEGLSNGRGGSFPISFAQLPQTNFYTSDQVRLGYGITPNERTSIDLSYYLANARFHVINPTDPTKTTYVDQNFRYSAPRASLVWRPNHDVAVRASIGGGFATPPLTDMVGTNSSVTCSAGICTQSLSNVNLQPETSWGFDVGFDKRLTQSTILSLDVYNTNLNGQIYQNAGTNGSCSTCGGLPLFTTQFRNLAQTRYKGIELDVRRDVPHGIVWRLSGSLMRGYIVSLPAGFYNTMTGTCDFSTGLNCASGTQSVVSNINFNGVFTQANVPYSQGFAMYGYRWSPDRFANLDVHYFGNNNGYYAPAFVAFDASAQVPLTKNIALQGTFQNITGILGYVPSNAAQGFIYPTAFGPPAYEYTIPYGPRTFLLTLRVHQ
jgi:outer membrane receptor protein involved in Fe transport